MQQVIAKKDQEVAEQQKQLESMKREMETLKKVMEARCMQATLYRMCQYYYTA